jgi:hypothetical protein
MHAATTKWARYTARRSALMAEVAGAAGPIGRRRAPAYFFAPCLATASAAFRIASGSPR